MPGKTFKLLFGGAVIHHPLCLESFTAVEMTMKNGMPELI